MRDRPGESGQTKPIVPLVVVVGLVVTAMALTYLARKAPVVNPDGKQPAQQAADDSQRAEPKQEKAKASPGLALARLFEPGTLAFAWCPDIQKAEAHLKTTPVFNIGNDPEIRDFLKDLAHKNPKHRQEYDQALPYGKMLRRVFRGGMALAILDIDPDRDTVDAVAVGGLAKGDNSIELLLDLFSRDLEAEGTIEAAEHAEKPYQVFSKPGEGKVLCWARLPEHIVAASTEKALRKVLDRIDANEPVKSLLDSDEFRRMRKRLGKEPDLAVFIDFDALKAKLATDPTELEHLRKLGLGGVKSVGLASRLGASGVTDRLIVSAPGKRSGLLALIDPKPSKPKCLTKLPSSSVLVLGLQLDPDRIWKELRALADADVAEREGMDELERGMEEATGLRFVQDVLGAFEGEVTAALTLTPIGSHPAVAVMIETKDRKKARRFAAAITQHITSKTALESETMRVAETEVHFFRGTGNFFVPSPSWAFKDGYLLVTSSTSAMSELLQTSRDESIATSKVYADFRKAVPAARPYVLFVDIPRLGALGYDLLQNLLLRYRGLLVEFDAARLPTAGSIRRYLNPGGITLTNDDEVIRIDAATPFGLVSTTAAAAAYGALADKLVPKAPTHPARRPLNPWPRGTRRGQR